MSRILVALVATAALAGCQTELEQRAEALSAEYNKRCVADEATGNVLCNRRLLSHSSINEPLGDPFTTCSGKVVQLRESARDAFVVWHDALQEKGVCLLVRSSLRIQKKVKAESSSGAMEKLRRIVNARLTRLQGFSPHEAALAIDLEAGPTMQILKAAHAAGWSNRRCHDDPQHFEWPARPLSAGQKAEQRACHLSRPATEPPSADFVTTFFDKEGQWCSSENECPTVTHVDPAEAPLTCDKGDKALRALKFGRIYMVGSCFDGSIGLLCAEPDGLGGYFRGTDAEGDELGDCEWWLGYDGKYHTHTYDGYPSWKYVGPAEPRNQVPQKTTLTKPGRYESTDGQVFEVLEILPPETPLHPELDCSFQELEYDAGSKLSLRVGNQPSISNGFYQGLICERWGNPHFLVMRHLEKGGEEGVILLDYCGGPQGLGFLREEDSCAHWRFLGK